MFIYSKTSVFAALCVLFLNCMAQQPHQEGELIPVETPALGAANAVNDLRARDELIPSPQITTAPAKPLIELEPRDPKKKKPKVITSTATNSTTSTSSAGGNHNAPLAGVAFLGLGMLAF